MVHQTEDEKDSNSKNFFKEDRNLASIIMSLASSFILIEGIMRKNKDNKIVDWIIAIIAAIMLWYWHKFGE